MLWTGFATISRLLLQVLQSSLHNTSVYGKHPISCGLFVAGRCSEEDECLGGAVRARDIMRAFCWCARAAPPDFSPRLRSKPRKRCLAPKAHCRNSGTMRQRTWEPAEWKCARCLLSWRHSGWCVRWTLHVITIVSSLGSRDTWLLLGYNIVKI